MQWIIRAMVAIALGLSTAAAEWHEVKSANFTVRGDASVATLEAFARELEQFRVFLGVITLGRAPGAEPVDVPVYVMASATSFGRIYPNPDANGAFTSRIDLPIFIGNAARDTTESSVRGQRRDAGATARETIKHEYVHHFSYINGPTYYPIWYSEGIADYFSTFTYEDGIARVGQLASRRGDWLVNRPLKPWARVFGSVREWLPPRSDEDVAMYYAQSWLAVHYFFNSRERAPQLRAYLGVLRNGSNDPLTDFSNAFDTSAEVVGSEISAYLRSNRLPVQALDLSAHAITPTLTTRRLDGVDADYAEAFARRFFVRDKASREALAADHDAILARSPQHLPTLLEAAFLAIDLGDLARAKAMADRAAAIDPANARVAILEGLLAGPTSLAARAAFDRARKADPRNPQAHYLYAGTFLGDATEEALDAAIAALHLSANRTNVPLRVGELLVELGYVEDARSILQPLTVWSTDPVIKARAEALLKRLAD